MSRAVTLAERPPALGALTTVRIDRARDRGRCVEPNVWMLHPLAARA